MNSIDLVKRFEGLRLTVYLDTGGVPTVGWGHVVQPRDRLSLGDRITETRAAQLLGKDMAQARRTVKRLVLVPLTEDQHAALESFVYNVGAEALEGSTLLQALNRGDIDRAAAEMGRWIHDNGKVVPGLVKRRAEEVQLLRGTAPEPPAPAVELLRRGDRGPAVEDLQRRYARLGLLGQAGLTGTFGPATERATRAVQALAGLEVDGIAGPVTLGVLGRAEQTLDSPKTPKGDDPTEGLVWLSGKGEGGAGQ